MSSKRHASRNRRSQHQNVLHLRVVTPRTVWFGFLRCFGGIIKLAAIIVLLAGLGWAGWRGIQQAFHKNPDFRLAVIDLNQNPIIDELGVARLAGIDLTKSPSLFDVDVSRTTQQLRALPALVDAKVERHLPDTLIVRVIPRSPRVWLDLGPGSPKPHAEGGLLVDTVNVAYPCPANLTESVSQLPVIQLTEDPQHPVSSGKPMTHPAYHHCLALYEAARTVDSEASLWIRSIRQANTWSLVLTTRSGTEATFSLGDHPRQMEQLRAALDHASNRGIAISTINLIPKYNVPVTLASSQPAPRAIPVNEPPAVPESRQSRDLNAILNRP